MKSTTSIMLLATLSLLISCNETEQKQPNELAKPVPVASSDSAHSHSHSHSHSHGNQPTISESISVAGITLNIDAHGTLAPGNEYHLDIALVDGPVGAVIRLWIGNEDGTGSMKTKADAHGDHYHAHVQAPLKLSNTSALWIDVQSTDGQTGKGRIELK